MEMKRVRGGYWERDSVSGPERIGVRGGHGGVAIRKESRDSVEKRIRRNNGGRWKLAERRKAEGGRGIWSEEG